MCCLSMQGLVPQIQSCNGGAGIGAAISSSLVLMLLPGREVPNNGKKKREREKFLYPSTLPPKTNSAALPPGTALQSVRWQS